MKMKFFSILLYTNWKPIVSSSYVDQKNKLVKVKSDETGLDFTVRLTVSNTAPSDPSVGDLWVDIS